MICWYCYWGWAKPVADIYTEALKRLDGDDTPLLYGPSHVVWEDENFGSASIRRCLAELAEFVGRFTESDLSVVKWSLEQLLALPEDDRCIEPIDYDGEHPELYPPTCEVVVV